jgi:hypothetical protein
LTEQCDAKETFSTLKRFGLYYYCTKGRKSTTIVLNVIQRLAGATEESPRALIIVEDKAKVLEMESLLKIR